MKDIGRNQRATQPLVPFIDFSDIAGAVTIGVALVFLVDALRDPNLPTIAFLALTYVLICDNWWGAHYMATNYSLRETTFFVEMIEVANFVLMARLASQGSMTVILTLVAYGALGAVWDFSLRSVIAKGSPERQVLELWTHAALVLALLFEIEFFAFGGGPAATPIAAVTSIAIWFTWRAVLGIRGRRITGQLV